MTGALRCWLSAVLYTGIVCCIIYMITPEGRVKKALRLMCALAMCAAVISPLGELDFEAYSKAATAGRLEAEKIAGQGTDYSSNLNRTVIEDECEAYILDKADELNVRLSSVAVTAKWSEEGYWYPYEVELTGEGDMEELEDIIEAQLGISGENRKRSDING